MKSDEKILEILDRLVAVRSVNDKPEPGAPFGPGPRKALDVMSEILSEMGLTPHIVADAFVYADWGNSSVQDNGYFAAVSHLDVVEEGKGWNTDPYKLTRIGDNLYGRGTLDNKGPSAAIMCAVARLISQGIKPCTPFRLLFGSCEESGSKDIPMYLESQKPPIFAFTPDCKFPVVYAEKGILNFKIFHNADGALDYVSIPDNQFSDVAIPATAKITICNKRFSSEGKTGHLAKPYLGENAITKIAKQIEKDKHLFDLHKSAKIPACIREYFIWLANMHNDFCGNRLGLGSLIKNNDINLTDPLLMSSAVPYSVELIDHEFVTSFSVRFPADVNIDDVKTTITKNNKNLKIEFGKQAIPAYVDPNNQYVQKLTNVYSQRAGNYCKPVVTSGGTYARHMPNTVAFGPSFPGSPHSDGIAHRPNEYIEINELRSLVDIYSKSIECLVC